MLVIYHTNVTKHEDHIVEGMIRTVDVHLVWQRRTILLQVEQLEKEKRDIYVTNVFARIRTVRHDNRAGRTIATTDVCHGLRMQNVGEEQRWTVIDPNRKVKSHGHWLVNDFWWPANRPWLWLVPEVRRYPVSSFQIRQFRSCPFRLVDLYSVLGTVSPCLRLHATCLLDNAWVWVGYSIYTTNFWAGPHLPILQHPFKFYCHPQGNNEQLACPC